MSSAAWTNTAPIIRCYLKKKTAYASLCEMLLKDSVSFSAHFYPYCTSFCSEVWLVAMRNQQK